MSEVPLISTEKQAELLQSSDISKFLKMAKSGAAHAAPPIPKGYSIVLMRSTKRLLMAIARWLKSNISMQLLRGTAKIEALARMGKYNAIFRTLQLD